MLYLYCIYVCSVCRMSARKLDFTGIWETPSLPVTLPVAKPPAPPAKRKKRYVYGFLIVFVFCWCLWASRDSSHRIRRVPCRRRNGAFSCRVSGYGDVIVELSRECFLHVFEVGGLPFTHARWKGTMFRVPSAREVLIRDAFVGCNPRVFLDSRPVLRSPTSDLVWCAGSDHTMFTVTVGGTLVLEETSGNLLDPSSNGVWTCYKFPVGGGSVRVTGNGQSQIHVYERPSKIMVSK